MKRYLLMSLALTGCAVQLPAGEFSCESNTDCVAGFSCVQGTCREGDDVRCVDDDGDGYGVAGAVTECARCRDEGRCEPDCDDTDDTIHPGADDVCDLRDNNCSGSADEALNCSDSSGCPAEGNVAGRCEGGVCVYYALLEFQPGCGGPVVCVDGGRAVPDSCR